MQMLVVDDSPDERLLIYHILKDAGCGEIRTARSAAHAFEQLALASPHGEATVDLILMDIRMPDIDGIEACRRIKEVERYHDIPILMVTVKDKAHFLNAAFEAGAMDYVTKPLDRVELLARVKSALKLKQEIDSRKSWERELTKCIESLQTALEEVETLRGVIPICSSCKSIRNDQNSWQQLEEYIQARSEARFNHDLCSDCAKKLYPDIDI